MNTNLFYLMKMISQLFFWRVHVHVQQMAHDNQRRRTESGFPFEVIFEILSWVTIEHLLRFQCVCKDWYALIRTPEFIVKQYDRASSLRKIPDIVKKQIDGKTEPINVNKSYRKFASSFGLFLEMSLTDNRSCRIRNPVTRQVVYLPDAHEGLNSFDFAINKSTGECKVVCYYHSGESEAGFQVITVGVDEQWRPLTHPNQDLLDEGILCGDEGMFIGTGNGMGYFSDLVLDGDYLQLEVYSLDIWKECFTSTSPLPRGVFEDLTEVRFIQWNGGVAIAEIGDEDLGVMVLEDYKVSKWSERKIVVPLQILKDEPELKEEIVHISADSYELTLETESERIYYDMTRQKVITDYDKQSEDESEAFTWLRPSLMALKGMKLEE